MGHKEKKILNEKGAALLLVFLILVAVLSIAFGVSSLLLTEVKLSREAPKSLRAYYAAEAGVEKKLYDIRMLSDPNDVGSAANNWCTGTGKACLDTDTCYAVDVTVGTPTSIKSYGCYKGVRRAIEVSF